MLNHILENEPTPFVRDLKDSLDEIIAKTYPIEIVDKLEKMTDTGL